MISCQGGLSFFLDAVSHYRQRLAAEELRGQKKFLAISISGMYFVLHRAYALMRKSANEQQQPQEQNDGSRNQ